jgi:pimeloyl-ACP methyl ester carboxylesterase
LVFDHLGYESVVLVGGDLGGPVIQEIALRNPTRVERMVLFNSPLPMDKERMAGMRTRPPVEVMDYFIRQGTDADALASELNTDEKRAAYISEFYSTRLWAHPGAFNLEDIAWHVEPFRDALKLRASFANYESAFDATKRIEKPLYGRNSVTPTLILFGTSDHVIYPDFDLMAATVFENHDGPVRIDNCGHFVPWEAAEEFIFRTVKFCAEN